MSLSFSNQNNIIATAAVVVGRTANSSTVNSSIDLSYDTGGLGKNVSNSFIDNFRNATVYIDGTKSAPTAILACSPRASPSIQPLQSNSLEGRKRYDLEHLKSTVDVDGYALCQYRKSFLDHLRIKNLITSTVRVAIQQGIIVLATFLSEQLEKDLKRNQLVNEGQMTQMEADIEAEEWEKVVWNERWKTFPIKLATSLTKFHAVTLILRFYEYVTDLIFKVDTVTMDKLTMDPFKKSQRVVEKIEKKALPYGKKESVLDHKGYVVKTMTASTFWANLLSFCADYSLHQGLLCYAYYKYYAYQRRRRMSILSDFTIEADDGDHDITKPSSPLSNILKNISDDDECLVEDFAKNSARLAANRNLGLVCSAIGGGIGSVVWPGWGTVVVSAIGDNIAGALLDDGYFKALETLETKMKNK